MGSLTNLLGRAHGLHQRINPQKWKLNGSECAGTGGPFERQLDLITGGYGDKISGPLTIPRTEISFTPLESMQVIDLTTEAAYKVAAVGSDTFAWRLTVEATRNPTAKNVPRSA